MSTRDTRREFDAIVRQLTSEDPSLAEPARVLPRRLALTLLAIGGGLLWGCLSVLMVIWGTPGVVLACLAVAAAVTAGIVVGRRRP